MPRHRMEKICHGPDGRCRVWMEAPLKMGYFTRPIQDARTGVSVDGKVLPLSTLPSAFVLF